MNQTFKKKVIAASLTMAFAAASGVVVGNEFAASTMSTVTAVVLVQGGAPKMSAALTLTESGTFANAVTNPLGFRVTIPAGIDLYGSYLTSTVGSTAATVATASKFAPTSGNIYPLRYTAATVDSASFIYIDTELGSSSALSTTTQTDTATMSTARNLAIFAVQGSSDVGGNINVGNKQMLLNGGKLNANASSSALSNFFTAGTASGAPGSNNQGSVTAAFAATNVELRKPDGVKTNISAVWNITDSNNIGSIKAETDGSLTITLFAGSQNSNASDPDKVVIPPLALAASSTATAGNASYTITDGINTTPASTELLNITGGTKAIATVTGNSLSVAKNVSTSTIPDGITTLSNQKTDPVKIAFSSLVSAGTGNTVTLTLSGGAKFVTGAAFAAGTAMSASTVYLTTASGDTTSTTTTGTHFSGDSKGGKGELNSDRTVLTLTLDNEGVAADDSFVIGGTGTGAFLDLTSATAGDVNMTVTSSIASAGSQTIKISNAVARGAAVTYADVAPTGYTTLFTGRLAQSTADTIVLTEAATGSLLANGAITLTLDMGAKFTAGDSITMTNAPVTSGTTSELAIANISAGGTVGTASTASASASGSVGTVSSTAKGKSTVSSLEFDLTSATTGDLTVTVSGGAGAAGAVKIATIANATSTSVSGTLPNVTPGGTASTLADIVITESAYGALTSTGGVMSVKLPSGVTYDTTTVPTVTVTKADGTALSSKITAPAVGHFSADYAGTAGSTYNLQIVAPSNSSEGPMTIKISGLKVSAASTASSGPLNVLIHGNSSALGTKAAAADEGSSGSNVGAMPTKQSVQAGTVVSANVSLPVTTATGTISSQTVTTDFVPAGNDQGKQGSVFLAALLPSSLGGGVYFMSSTNAWTLYASCATVPAYFTGNLAAVSGIKVAEAMDVSGLVGTQIYVGHGLGGALSPAGTACTNMLNNGSYSLTYTVK